MQNATARGRPTQPRRNRNRSGFIATCSNDWPPTSCESASGLQRYGLPAARLFQGPEQPDASACQAITVSGLTMTSAVRQPVQMRDSIPADGLPFASRNRRGRVRCGTCSLCRNASTSSWSSACERADPRRVRRSDRSADIVAEKRIHDGRRRYADERL